MHDHGGCRLAAQLSAEGGPLQDWPARPQLAAWAGTQLLQAGLVALAGCASVTHQAEVLSTLRLLLVQQLASQPGPRQVRLLPPPPPQPPPPPPPSSSPPPLPL